MPDYAIVKSLCDELDITIAELMDGEVNEEKSMRTYDEDQIVYRGNACGGLCSGKKSGSQVVF